MASLIPRTSCVWRGLSSTTRKQPRRILILGTFRSFSITPQARQTKHNSSKMEVELTAPNGKKWTQPLGLFINNEFVKSSNGQTITSINPACVHQPPSPQCGARHSVLNAQLPANSAPAPRRRSAPSSPRRPMMSTRQWLPPARPSNTRLGRGSRARSAAP